MKKIFKKVLSLILIISMLINIVLFTGCNNISTLDNNDKKNQDTEKVEYVSDEVAAEQIIYGNIITMDDKNSLEKAVAVKEGRIIYVGTVDGAKEYFGENTKVLDYGENCVYPGFLDAHEHGVLYGWRAIGQANLLDGESYDDYVTIFKKYIEDNPGKEYYMASGWNVLGNPPTHELLDKVSIDIPLVANSGDGHSMLLNKKAMEICGVTKDIVNEYAPGEIKVDETGEPTGMLSEEPAISLLQNMPFTLEDVKKYILEWQNFAFAHGYTGGGEGGDKLITPLQGQAYSELAKEGKLKYRTYSFATINDNTETPENDVEEVLKEAQENDTEFYKTIGLKVFLDGVLEADTSWMIDEYKNKPGYTGVKRFDDHDKMVRLITAASKNNLSVHAHSVGDGATKFMLDCIEDSQKETGDLDQRNACAHLQHVREEDFERFGSTNTIAVTAPLWIPTTDYVFEKEALSIGTEKAMTDYPIKSFINAGAHVVFHSDYPAGFTLNAPATIYLAKERSGDKEMSNLLGVNIIGRGFNEKLTAKEALLALTKDVAYFFHEEDNLGSIEVGKYADFSVFPSNFLTDKLSSSVKAYTMEPVATIVAGEVVYSNE